MDINLANASLIEQMYALYQEDATQVDPSWQAFFAQPERQPAAVENAPSELRIYNLIQAYRTYGHLLANVNPIATHLQEEPRQLKLENLGFLPADLHKPFPTNGLLKEEFAPLEKIIQALKKIYCDQIGFEYMDTLNEELKSWLQKRIEPLKVDLSMDQKRMILHQLNKSELFEVFLHTKYTGQKRFSIEGGETLIPMLASALEKGSTLDVETFVIGMAHRGRLNVLSNILEKSYATIFSEFEEGYIPQSFEGSGDVKYHKGFSAEVTLHGRKVEIFLTPNPSHLEAVNPVVEGQTYARQLLQGRSKVVPILIHGDAAIAGQGVVYETLQLNGLEGYTTGGTLHLVINNQIGFTTLPQDSRSTYYCTDIARAFNAPVFHVNAEDPEGCVFVMNLAVELRQKFHCDVFIDLNCYRKYGHNETDEPAFTQPLEYQLIKSKKPIRELYRDTLVHHGVMEKKMAESLEEEFKKGLHEELEQLKITPKVPSAAAHADPALLFQPCQTQCSKEFLVNVAEKMSVIPPDLTIHKKLERLIQDRLAMVKEGKPIDWGMGEMLAYATLLWEGKSVRLSGQDSCRGTFSHRHALWMDQVKERAYFPLKHLKSGQGRFDVINSPLSEFAALGFEFGYSTFFSEALVIWEAQFGDFCNGAQVIIDQFISTAEQKWGQKTNLVMLLPHGYEGQGPEHSSGRIERFLSLCGDENLVVVNPTTPAQMFHLLRRQVLKPMNKPMVVFTPKGLLRHPECVNQLKDFEQGTFQEILDDQRQPKKGKTLILCSGRIYYDLLPLRKEEWVIIRIEQLYPLHKKRLTEILKNYPAVERAVWVQEEPANMGAWDYIRQQLKEIVELEYCGRERSAATATGSYALHKKQHQAIIDNLMRTHEARD